MENMLEEIVATRRVVYDAILSASIAVRNLHSNPKMIASVR